MYGKVTPFGQLLRTARFMTDPPTLMAHMARACRIGSARLSKLEHEAGADSITREEIQAISRYLMEMVYDTTAAARLIQVIKGDHPMVLLDNVVPIGEGNAQIRQRLPKPRPARMDIPLQDDPGVPNCMECGKAEADIPDSRTECLAQNGGAEWWLYCPECDVETFSQTFLEGVELLCDP